MYKNFVAFSKMINSCITSSLGTLQDDYKLFGAHCLLKSVHTNEMVFTVYSKMVVIFDIS